MKRDAKLKNMPKFIKFLVPINVLLWGLWLFILFSKSADSYGEIFSFLTVFVLAFGLTLSFPFYFIYRKKSPKFMDLKMLYRRALKWGFFISFGLSGLAFLKAFHLINLLNTGLFGLLYIGIFVQLKGKK